MKKFRKIERKNEKVQKDRNIDRDIEEYKHINIER